MKYIVVTIAVLLIITLVVWDNKKIEDGHKEFASLTECEKVEHEINNSISVFRQQNALIRQQNMILQGKCILKE